MEKLSRKDIEIISGGIKDNKEKMEYDFFMYREFKNFKQNEGFMEKWIVKPYKKTMYVTKQIYNCLDEKKEELAKGLIENNKIDTLDKIYMMFSAIKKNMKEVAKVLISYNEINLEYTDVRGDTFLIKAIKYNRKEIISSLLTAEVEVSTTNKEGRNALHVAVLKGNEEIVNILSNYCVLDYDNKDIDGIGISDRARETTNDNIKKAVKENFSKSMLLNFIYYYGYNITSENIGEEAKRVIVENYDEILKLRYEYEKLIENIDGRPINGNMGDYDINIILGDEARTKVWYYNISNNINL